MRLSFGRSCALSAATRFYLPIAERLLNRDPDSLVLAGAVEAAMLRAYAARLSHALLERFACRIGEFSAPTGEIPQVPQFSGGETVKT